MSGHPGILIASIGDPILQLLGKMAVGEWKRLNNTAYNLLTGPGGTASEVASGLAGSLFFNRDRFDAGQNFANDAAVLDYVCGKGLYTGENAGNMFYSGCAYDRRRHCVRLIGGGHSNGGNTAFLAFDCRSAAQKILEGRRDGPRRDGRQTWEAYSDPNPLSAVDSDNDQRERHPEWPRISKVSEPFDLRYPQPVRSGRNYFSARPGGIGPYSLHTYSAVVYDDRHDRIYVSGGSVGSTWEGGINPGAFWYLDHPSRMWTRIDRISRGSDGAAFLMSPDGSDSHLYFLRDSLSFAAYEIDTGAVRTTSVQGPAGNGSVNSAPMWIKGLSTEGRWDIVRMAMPGGYGLGFPRFAVHPRQFPVPTAPQAHVMMPAHRTEPYVGAPRRFSEGAGFCYVASLKKIFCVYNLAGGIQTVDPFRGQSSAAEQWVIDDWRGSGDLPSNVADPERDNQAGFQNRLIDLGPPFHALVLVMNAFRGDVYLIRYL